MTKNERRELDKATALAAAGHTDMAARTLAIVHRCTRNSRTQAEIVKAVYALGLSARVRFLQLRLGGSYAMVHVDDVPAVRS